jgi:thiol-disulfide isomerase/thioredoxin
MIPCPKHITMIGFFADWCPHCVSFKPEFEGAKEESPENVHWHIFSDKTEEGQAAMAEYEVRGFPTVLVYFCSTGKYNNYTGPRTKEGLLTFIDSYQKDNRI